MSENTVSLKDVLMEMDFVKRTQFSTHFVRFVADKEWPHYLWTVVMVCPDGSEFVTEYKCGTAWKDKRGLPVPPDAADVVASLLIEDPSSEPFEDWCGNRGWDCDSRKALDAYLRCQKQTSEFYKTLSACKFTRDERALMDEAASQY